MSIQLKPLTLEEIQELKSSTISVGQGLSSPSYGAIPNITVTTAGTGYTYSTTGVTSTLGNVVWTSTPNTATSWTADSSWYDKSTISSNPGGKITLKGEGADIDINGKSLKATLEALEERLNWMQPNPELEKEWDELRRLGNRYRAMEKKCRDKAKMWEQLKKVQPKSQE